MHHQLDELGCPSLCCTLNGKHPADSWLAHTSFPNFVRGLLVQLWELIQVCLHHFFSTPVVRADSGVRLPFQHSRFNQMLDRIFHCGPQSARDAEFRSYISRRVVPMFGLCGEDGHASLIKIAVAAHVAAIILEGSHEVYKEFVAFVRKRYDQGDSMVWHTASPVTSNASNDSRFLVTGGTRQGDCRTSAML